MKRFHRPLLRAVAIVALILLVATCVLWIRSRRHIDSVDFSRFGRSFRMESDSRNGLYLSVTNLSPTISARVTGMAATANGWTAAPGQPITFRIAALPTGTNAMPGASGNSPKPISPYPLAISRMRMDFHGFVWSSGFTAQHATLPGPFPACQVDTFTLSYITAVVVSALTMLIAGYLGLRRGEQIPAGRCPKCGYDLRASPDRCPECGTVPSAPEISPGQYKRI